MSRPPQPELVIVVVPSVGAHLSQDPSVAVVRNRVSVLTPLGQEPHAVALPSVAVGRIPESSMVEAAVPSLSQAVALVSLFVLPLEYAPSCREDFCVLGLTQEWLPLQLRRRWKPVSPAPVPHHVSGHNDSWVLHVSADKNCPHPTPVACLTPSQSKCP